MSGYFNNHRCAVCNRVSSVLIETNVEDYTKKRFFRDDKHADVICEDCKEVHEDLMLDYEGQDDPWRNYSNDNSNYDLWIIRDSAERKDIPEDAELYEEEA
jgi:hypothetical protein